MPDDRRLLRQLADTWAYRSAICPIVLRAKTTGCAFPSSTVSGSSGHPGVNAA
jgi:hypothetical protein